MVQPWFRLDSSLVQIPAPILLTDLTHELTIFGAFHRQVNAEEFTAEGLPGPTRTFQRSQGGQPVCRQQFRGLGVAIAFHRRTRVESLADTAMNTGQNRRSRQIGVGIRATNSMLDVPGIRRPAGYA